MFFTFPPPYSSLVASIYIPFFICSCYHTAMYYTCLFPGLSFKYKGLPHHKRSCAEIAICKKPDFMNIQNLREQVITVFNTLPAETLVSQTMLSNTLSCWTIHGKGRERKERNYHFLLSRTLDVSTTMRQCSAWLFTDSTVGYKMYYSNFIFIFFLTGLID